MSTLFHVDESTWSQRGTRHPRGFSTFCSGYKYFRPYDHGSRKRPCILARKPSEVIYTFILATERKHSPW